MLGEIVDGDLGVKWVSCSGIHGVMVLGLGCFAQGLYSVGIMCCCGCEN